jgi:hypothetical protein
MARRSDEQVLLKEEGQGIFYNPLPFFIIEYIQLSFGASTSVLRPLIHVSQYTLVCGFHIHVQDRYQFIPAVFTCHNFHP